MTWVATKRTSTGYDVRESRKGYLVGWVKWDGEWWHSYCRTCESGHAASGSKTDAVEQVVQHNAIEHRP